MLRAYDVSERFEQTLQNVRSTTARQRSNPRNQRQREVHISGRPLLAPAKALLRTRAMATLRKDEAT